MSEARIEPDMVTYNTVINALARCGRVKEAMDHVQAMKDQGLSPDVVTFGTLIHACAQSSRREAALALFAELVRFIFFIAAATVNTIVFLVLSGFPTTLPVRSCFVSRWDLVERFGGCAVGGYRRRGVMYDIFVNG